VILLLALLNLEVACEKEFATLISRTNLLTIASTPELLCRRSSSARALAPISKWADRSTSCRMSQDRALVSAEIVHHRFKVFFWQINSIGKVHLFEPCVPRLVNEETRIVLISRNVRVSRKGLDTL
jgi:hypothetical protein